MLYLQQSKLLFPKVQNYVCENKSTIYLIYYQTQFETTNNLNKLSETNTPLLYYFMNGMMIEFTLQTLHDKIQSNSLDGTEIPAIQTRDEMIDKILNL